MKKIYFAKRHSFLTLLFSAGVSLSLFSQQSFTFTSAGATGVSGPSQTQVNTAYFSTNLNGSVSVTGGIQSFTIPSTGPYRIAVYGAQGGGSTGGANTGSVGGLGAAMVGDFTLTTGQVLRILVGQQGGSEPYGGGGGGGSFVTDNSNNPIIIAGGGGGGNGYVGYSRGVFAGGCGLITTAGGNSNQTNGTYGAAAPGIGGGAVAMGGINGYGGGGAVTAGGGGFYNNGGAGSNAFPGSGFLQGGTGGAGNSTFNMGGFGGGAGGTLSSGYGGGGGGYSGGGGGNWDGTTHGNGGGGGSLNTGANQSNTACINPGNGRVIISQLCFISLTSSGSNSLAPAICSGNSVTLTTNAVSNYTWSNNNTTTTSIVVSPNTTSTYSVTGTSSANCQASNFITVTVSPGLPVLSISNPSNNICLGRTVSLTASGALTYTWSNPGVVNGQTFTPNSTAVYTVTGQNGCGISVGTTTITVAPLPVTVLATPSIVCQGFAASLSATSAVTNYTWQPGNLPGATTAVSPTANTIYTVTASDGTCAGTQTVSLQTKISPTITAVASSTRICQGDPVTLTASGAGTGGSYSWTPGGPGASITMSPAISALFSVAGTNSVNCTTSAQQAVVVDMAPAMNVVANKTLVCIQSSAILTASGANSYTWTNGPFVAAYTVTPTGALTIYTVMGSHQTNSCTATRTIAITAVIPNVAVTSTTGICEGASATLVASGATTYSWNGINNGSSGTFQPTPPTTTVYQLVAFTSSANVNCPSYHTATVVVYANPTIVVTPGKQTICKGETHTLTATGAVTYSWSTTPGTGSVITVKPNSTTSYAVTGIDANGCENSTSYTAKVSACIDITEMQGNQDISVYPNPSTGEFAVSTTSDIALKIVNSIGQQVRVVTLDAGNDHKVQVKDLSSGVYFIVGENAEGKVNQKIIITK